MTQPGQSTFDPFEQGGGVRAVSFKNAPVGSFISIDIDEDAKWLQSRDFETGELEFWDARPGEQPNPKMAAVITGTVLPSPWAQESGQVGERRSLWAGSPSAMFSAIQAAKRQAAVGQGQPVPQGTKGLPILAGGKLHIAYTGEIPNEKNPRLNNIKQYSAQYDVPPAGYGKQDAFEGNQAFTGGQQQPQQQAAQQPVQQFQPQQPVQQPQFAQQAFQQPAQQPIQQPQFAQQGAPVQQPQFAQQGATGFGGQAPQQPVQQPQFAQQGAPGQFGGQAPQQAASDPWSSAPVASSDVPNF